MELPDIDDCSKQELYNSLAHAGADIHRLEELLKTLCKNFSDEIVCKDRDNYLKINVSDIPEELIDYFE